MFLLLNTLASAGEWVSPVDNKYKSLHPELFSDFSEARKLLDEYRGNKKNLMQAQQLLNSIIDKEKSFAPAYLEYGRLIMKGGYYTADNFKPGVLDGTESVILKAIKIEPDYADAYVLLGYTYTKNRHFSQAEKALQKARKLGTKNPWLDLNYADLLKRTGRYKNAIEYILNAVNTDIDNPNAHSGALSKLANYYRDFNDYDEAEYWHKKRVAFESSAWNWGDYASFLLFNRADIEGSIEKGEKAISIKSYGLARLYLACAYYAKWHQLINEGKENEAEQYYTKAADIYPDKKRAIKNLGGIRGMQEAALAIMKKEKIDWNMLQD